MMDKETGGLAFPALDNSGSGLHLRESGMTLRDYFAAKAMQGICADPSFNPQTGQEIAMIAYVIADTMLAERAK
jgi:hypothetical protein